MTARIRLTRAQKVRIFERARGICHICGLRIQVGQRWDVEHIKPISMDGSDITDNMAPAHVRPCHREKTDAETPIRAKTDRQRANHLGIPKPGPKLPAGRNSGITKTILKGVQPRRSGPQKHRDLLDKLYPWRIPE